MFTLAIQIQNQHRQDFLEMEWIFAKYFQIANVMKVLILLVQILTRIVPLPLLHQQQLRQLRRPQVLRQHLAVQQRQVQQRQLQQLQQRRLQVQVQLQDVQVQELLDLQ
jgi:hypothetical protein